MRRCVRGETLGLWRAIGLRVRGVGFMHGGDSGRPVWGTQAPDTADRGEQPFSIDSLWSSSLCHLLFGFVTESETCLYAT